MRRSEGRPSPTRANPTPSSKMRWSHAANRHLIQNGTFCAHCHDVMQSYIRFELRLGLALIRKVLLSGGWTVSNPLAGAGTRGAGIVNVYGVHSRRTALMIHSLHPSLWLHGQFADRMTLVLRPHDVHLELYICRYKNE